MKNKKYIIFGAGRYGEEALLYFGIKNVAFFCDNNKVGSTIKGIEIIDFSKLTHIWKEYTVVLAVANRQYKEQMQKQLELAAIEYEIFQSIGAELQADNFKGEYQFIDRSKSKEKLLMILAGYKEYLWEEVFRRIAAYAPEDVDICVMTAGYKCAALVELCEKQGWSYLWTVENKLSLTQNLTIRMHPSAKWIYKLDEDIFVTPSLFEELYDTYKYVDAEKKHAIGFVAPIMAINSYGYRRVLKTADCLEDYEKKFGSAVLGRGPVFSSPDVAEYLWNKTLPINAFAEKIKDTEQKYSICYHRYSIGCMLMPRTVWEAFGGFLIAPEGVLGIDEEHLCQWCMNSSHAIVIAEKAYAGHFAYGAQSERMKELYDEVPERWR